jgi:molybdopterin converting factor small subunit
MDVQVLAFGPLAEKLGKREHTISLPPQCSVRFLLEELELEDWLQLGLAIAVNGQKVGEDHALSESDEVALLPPVSGG